MSVVASQLLAVVNVVGAAEAEGQLLGVGAASDAAGSKLQKVLVGGALLAGASLVAIGAKSVEMAGQFEQSTNLLITSAGEVPANIDLIRKGLLQMSVDTATPVDELTKGMFNIESAGYHGAAGLKVEQAAAEGAKVENADLAAVTDVLTTAMHNYSLPASQAVDVMNSFRLSASIGKMRMDDLTGALTNVLPIASQAGVKLSDVEAALSTMSLAGDKGAMAGTHLQMMLTQLLAPSSKATGALKEVGLTTQEISDEMKVSLPGTVQMITDAVGKKFPVGSAAYIAAISAIVGGSKSMKAIMELSGVSLKTFTQDASQLAPTMKANSTAVDGWNTVQSNFNFKLQAAENAVSALMITLGTKLLPVVGQVVSAVTPLIMSFSDWMNKSSGLSGAIDQVSSAFQQVFEPVKKVQDVTKPLLDTFDRATSIFAKTNTEAKPLLDTFDRGKSILTTTNAVAMPLFDTFDRATALLPKTTDAVKKTTDAVSPLVSIFKDWKPVIEDVFKDVETLTADAVIFATGIVDAAAKSGLFQSALQFLHDELPVVGSFLVNVGGDINANLLPPLESLITNVGSAAAGFIDWADKSGAAKTALSLLGGAVTLTTEVLGPLIQAVSDVVGWLGGGGAGTDTLIVALSAAATAFTLLKIADTATQFSNFVSKLQEGDGIITNLASSVKDKLAKGFDDFLANQAPHLKQSLDDAKTSASEAGTALGDIGGEAEASAGKFDTLTANMNQLSSMTAEGAAAASAEVGSIGTAAETSATEVAASSAEMETSLEGVGTAATGAEGGIAAVGTSAATAGAGVVSGFGAVAAGIMTAGIAAIVGIEAYMLKDATPALIDSWNNADFKEPAPFRSANAQMQYDSYDTAHHIKSNFSDASNNVSTDAQKMQQAVVDAGNQMAEKTLASLEVMDSASLTDTTKLSASVTRVFNEMKTSGVQSLADLDGSGKSYLADLQAYVNAMNAQLNLASDNTRARNTPGSGLAQKNAYASGTDYVPQTGTYMVGEQGPERVVLPQGAKVIPHDQLGSSGAWSGGGGSGGGGTKQPLVIPLIINGREFARATVDDIGDALARNARLSQPRRAYT